MKTSSFFFLILISNIMLFACESKRKKESNVGIIKKYDFSNSLDFKYETINEVILYSFLNKSSIKTLPYRKDVNYNSDVQLSNDFIKERILLDEKQKQELFHLITKDSCPKEQHLADCYNPRHEVVFKNKSNEIMGSIEICFECNDFRHSKSLGEATYYCHDAMRLFFWKAGIRYFINDDHKGKMTEDEFNEIEKKYKLLAK
ncbi:hypothetical protein [Flavobacterium sp. NRK F7]|uniref:hypothetical protein n=1 Tax=Flavobacterium sp. NRK F7 TaxID=2954930 RepID=UPI00209160A4|nr:hypothetical protein [Flavobacterium sp. NRK F7]MCO6163922.1 hypothetical protein [Flavobacterium sp. NRK F7]